VSLLILALIVLSGIPTWIRKCVHTVRLMQARKKRCARMIADLADLERAGSSLEGLTLFDEEEVFS
ncbi:MAG: hypothetical protein AAGF67_05890, partial [Verrucomicrobiota bacterium]